jgi:hypothetical protein
MHPKATDRSRPGGKSGKQSLQIQQRSFPKRMAPDNREPHRESCPSSSWPTWKPPSNRSPTTARWRDAKNRNPSQQFTGSLTGENAALAAVFAQGPLTPPPGVPAPTMKTLDQIEPLGIGRSWDFLYRGASCKATRSRWLCASSRFRRWLISHRCLRESNHPCKDSRELHAWIVMTRRASPSMTVMCPPLSSIFHRPQLKE